MEWKNVGMEMSGSEQCDINMKAKYKEKNDRECMHYMGTQVCLRSALKYRHLCSV